MGIFYIIAAGLILGQICLFQARASLAPRLTRRRKNWELPGGALGGRGAVPLERDLSLGVGNTQLLHTLPRSRSLAPPGWLNPRDGVWWS